LRPLSSENSKSGTKSVEQTYQNSTPSLPPPYRHFFQKALPTMTPTLPPHVAKPDRNPPTYPAPNPNGILVLNRTSESSPFSSQINNNITCGPTGDPH